MAHYDDIVLPNTVRFGSGRVPFTNTQIGYTGSGFRKTNRIWSQKLRRLKLIYHDEIAGIYTLGKTWEAVEGPNHSFLARDWHDWNTTDGNMKPGNESLTTAFDQPLQNTTDDSFVADGSTAAFQLVKQYTVGSLTHTRKIEKPQNGTIKISVDGVVQTEGAGNDYTINYSTGIVTFNGGSIPGASGSPTAVAVNWGGAFYIPVAFVDDDAFEQKLANLEADDADIELEEVKLT